MPSTNNTLRGLDIWGSSVGFDSPDAEPASRLAVSNNDAEGIQLGANGDLFSKLPSEIKNNAYEGVGVWGGSYVDLTRATIADNKDFGGMAVATNSSVFLASCRIENNVDDGIQIGNNSTVHLRATVITGNTGHGIAAYNHSFVQGLQDTTGSSITNNGNDGVHAWNGASIQLSKATITGNANDDVDASFGSRFHFFGGSTIGDIECDDSVLAQGDKVCPE